MIKLLTGATLLIALCSCTNTSSNSGTAATPSAKDTSQQGDGVTNAEVISTDTAAMRVHGFKDSDSLHKKAH